MLTKTKRNVSREEYSKCDEAVFLDQDQQVSTDAAVPPDGRRMALDWAIGRSTCDNNCSHLSWCMDVPSGADYLCRCRPGYDGNPYLAGGCMDIDECRNLDTNNCSRLDFCENIPGGFTCSCPPDMDGDGYRTGKGCSASPATALPKGLDACATQNNPCVHPNYCTEEQGAGWCACPGGMTGDGRIMGTGCRKEFPVYIALAVGLALVFTITTTALCISWTMKKIRVGRMRAELFRKNGGLLLQQRFSASASQGKYLSAKIFSAEELKTATDNYSESRILGRGGHGTVYKGILPDKTMVAIKKSTVFDESQVEQFVNEITILSQIDHPNVVKLTGCCLETQVPLLVYEFIPNGTLFQHIHNRSAPRSLTWDDCIRIAAETAEALAYLHSASSIPIIHRDIKSSNILLDENYVAKISDFGISRSVPFDRTHVTTLVQGTIGYLDPEYFQNSQLTQKSDVYSFGVVLAELLTRERPVSVAKSEESCNLAMYLEMLFNEGRLLQEIEPHILAEAGEEQLYAVAQLSMRCLNVKGEERPAMKEVTSVLDGLRRSFTKEQTSRRKHESVRRKNEDEYLLRETRPPRSVHSSEGSIQYSMEAEMLASSHLPR